MDNKLYVFVYIRNYETAVSGQYFWKEVYGGESLSKAIMTFVKLYLKAEVGCIKLEGRP